jgi:Family of unknown function (DUF6345)/Bacterial Ig domain
MDRPSAKKEGHSHKMKINLIPRWAVGALVFFVGLMSTVLGQLEFTRISATPEGAIKLTWASISNETYEIDEADTLETNAQGTLDWNQLYTQYPSQGTNTFWLDTGNYSATPPIVHPKYSATRFYRIVDLGPDTAIPDEPEVAITSPASGAVASNTLEITVTAATDQPVLNTKLYVDGQEMQMADSTTNYVNGATNYVTATYTINTCEWWNGAHTLFATAGTYSTMEGQNNGTQPLIGHSVSAFVPVTFSNLISSVSFSEWFFDPDSGETQQVSAVFAADCNWTLNVIDISSNTVLTTNGSGLNLLWNFNGNGTNGSALPAGVYHYVITAQTNGEVSSGGGQGTNGGGGSGPPPPGSDSEERANSGGSTELFAEPADGSGIAVPLIIYPPGYDTNSLKIFEVTQEDGVSSSEESVGAEGIHPMGSPVGASQTTTVPRRPPTMPAIRVAGTVGIGCQRYPLWTSEYAPAAPDNGLNIGITIQMQGTGGSHPIKYGTLLGYGDEANYFKTSMQNYAGWKTTINKVDNNLGLSDLQGQSTPFNGVNIAVLLLHGTYGTSIDYAANGCEQMYFPIASGGSGTYLRMSGMNFGGGGQNGLKWMAIVACFSLQHNNWANMQNNGVKPYNGNLHLLLGCDTIEYAQPNMLAWWAQYMASGMTNNNPMQVRAAWYAAGTSAFNYAIMPQGQTALYWAVAGDNNCYYDMLQTNYNPGGTWFYERNAIWNPH